MLNVVLIFVLLFMIVMWLCVKVLLMSCLNSVDVCGVSLDILMIVWLLVVSV